MIHRTADEVICDSLVQEDMVHIVRMDQTRLEMHVEQVIRDRDRYLDRLKHLRDNANTAADMSSQMGISTMASWLRQQIILEIGAD